MKRATRILLVLPLLIMAAYVVGFRGTTGEALLGTPQNDEIIFGCVHHWDSDFDCPELNPQQGVKWVPTAEVDTIKIILRMKDGTTRTWTHRVHHEAPADTANVDAVFFTEFAVFKIYNAYMREAGYTPDSIVGLWRTLPRPHLVPSGESGK